MKRFLALALGVLVLGSLSGCKQLGCNNPAKNEAPAAVANDAAALPDSAPNGAPESNSEKPA